jgi:CBS domain containing-hemolysin-like protein
MAPKSWVIAAPERSAVLLALPFRGFTKLFRPVLMALNGITNGLLRLCRVMPRDAFVISRTPEQLKHLVEESRRLGLIDEADRNVLSRALQAPQARLGSLIVPIGEASSVAPDSLPQAVIDTATRTGHTRLLLRTESGEVTGLVHAREAYLARAAGKTCKAATMAHPVPVLAEETPVAEAVTALRRHHSQLAMVQDSAGRVIGLISLDDLLTSLLSPA